MVRDVHASPELGLGIRQRAARIAVQHLEDSSGGDEGVVVAVAIGLAEEHVARLLEARRGR